MSDKFEEAAKSIISYMEFDKDDPIQFDPTLLLVIAQIIIFILQNCKKKPESIRQDCENRGILARWVVKSAIKKVVNDKEFARLYGDRIQEAIFKAGALPNHVDEIGDLMKEAVTIDLW